MSTDDPALLVVDDNDDNRYTLVHRLRRLGYANVTTAVDGRQALERLQERDFDLVLLDVMMPELNGYEVLERIRASERLRHTPVIMISAVGELDSVVRCIELGAEDYLPKPFNPTLLGARVKASLEKKRLRDEVRAHRDQLEAELRAARDIQLAMVPASFPAAIPSSPVEIFASLRPAREVGGDFYDFFASDTRTVWFVMADVSDKGAPAALFMARTKTLLRPVTALLPPANGVRLTPGEVLARVNEELCRDNNQRMFVTAFFGMLEAASGELQFCNAGHNVPYVTSARGRVRPLVGARSKPLGIDPAFRYETTACVLAPDEGLFVFTDGITEAMDRAGAFFTEERLEAALDSGVGASARAMVERVLRAVEEFAGGATPSDDIAAMALRLVTLDTLEIIVLNRLDELSRVSRIVDRLAAVHAVPGEIVADVQVALDEVLTNIMTHAYADDRRHEIAIRFRVADGFEVEIEDDGAPFDPRTTPAPVRGTSLREREIGGVGVHFIKSLMDEVGYTRVGDRNRLVLRRKFSDRMEAERHGSP